MDAENATAANTSENSPILQNILLVGFMGCGKSTIGRELHQSLGYPLFDTDEVIEGQTGKKIPEIFAQDGEDYFRQRETRLLENLIQQQTQHSIISTGGGIITRPENIPLLRKLGFVVWLSCSPEVIYERTSRNNNRPLLQCDNPKELITHLLDQREAHYQASSHLKISSSNLAISEITCGILESARYHFSSPENPSEG
jgi:shikimate kinase